MAQVNIRIDDTLKAQGEKLFKAMGLNFSTAVSVFVSQSLREGGLPFQVTTQVEPFFSEENLSILRASIADINDGRGIIRKNIGDLEAMENG